MSEPHVHSVDPLAGCVLEAFSGERIKLGSSRQGIPLAVTLRRRPGASTAEVTDNAFDVDSAGVFDLGLGPSYPGSARVIAFPAAAREWIVPLSARHHSEPSPEAGNYKRWGGGTWCAMEPIPRLIARSVAKGGLPSISAVELDAYLEALGRDGTYPWAGFDLRIYGARG